MRGRLNKTQMQMLLDGKPLKHGSRTFQLQEGESEVRTILGNLVRNDRIRQRYSVYLNLDLGVIEIEEEK